MVSWQLNRSGLTLDRFWIRENGLSSKITKIRLYDQLKPGEQLFACILRNDDVSAAQLLKDPGSRHTFESLIELSSQNQFARLILDRLFDSELLSFLPEDLRKELTDLAMQETAFQKIIAKRFTELLCSVSALKQHHLWIKGVSLSRMVYSDINHRNYGDLDLVVRREKLVETIQAIIKLGFVVHNSPAFCNQIGVGPLSCAADLLLSPHPDLIPTSALSLRKEGWPMIDIKFGPFDRGIQMLELERCFDEAESLISGGERFFAPNAVDHLMISVHNLDKDRFSSWKNLYDIHLLALKVTDDPIQWSQFVARCKRESIELSAWFGLSLAVDRFGTPVPNVVLAKLRPNGPIWQQQITLTISPFFVWNATSLPMMLANACLSSDWKRKTSMLARSIFPSREFLAAYYSKNRCLTNFSHLPILLLHWLNLLSPGGLVRSGMGKYLWTDNRILDDPLLDGLQITKDTSEATAALVGAATSTVSIRSSL